MSWSYPSANSKGIKLERFAPDISLRARTSSEDGWFHLGCQECPGPACFSKDRKNIYIYISIYIYIVYIYIYISYIYLFTVYLYILYICIYIYVIVFQSLIEVPDGRVGTPSMPAPDCNIST